MQKIYKFLFSRLVINSILIFGQALVFYILLYRLSEYFRLVYFLFLISGLFISLIVLNDDSHNSSFKIPWLLILMILPIFGVLLYVLNGKVWIKKKVRDANYLSNNYTKNSSNLELIKKDNKLVYEQAKYICNMNKVSSYDNTEVTYYPLGDLMYNDMLKELNKAEKFIFLEYFIIEEGIMWNSILDILLKKIADGVDVRIMYDDIGCIGKLPNNYYKKLQKLGVNCIVFNPFVPILSIIHNNRDHRKAMIIDAKVAYTGGINLADEYINKQVKYGHWKDCGVKLEGEAVNSLTMMFLDSWNLQCKTDVDYDSFLANGSKNDNNNSIVIPYNDSPLNIEPLGQTVYINMINSATDYLYIETPYFVVSSEMVYAIGNAAKRGVDVKIITPRIPDKWFVHAITESYYPLLIESGVKIYEYEPGFIHSKMVLCDDKVAAVGTINFDYRSFYHHYENGVWIYNSDAIFSMKEDFNQTIDRCIYMDIDKYHSTKWYKRLCGKLLKIFAPLM